MKLKYVDDIAVIGLGRFGQSVVDQLLKLGKNVTIIDKNEERLRLYEEDADNILIGDAAETKFLKGIDIDKIGTVVVAVPNNIEIVAALIEMKVSNLIVRATSRRHAKVLKLIGAHVIIRPEYEAGKRAALISANTNFLRYSDNLQELGDDFVLGTTQVKNPDLFDKKIKDLSLNQRGITIVLIKNKSKNTRPTGDSTLKKDDLVTVIGEVQDVTQAFQWFNKE
ncbi:TrkA family potassium uptake protein [Mycoplasma sp. OR1901]|uniref:potassium channel family protein n=1 Tax=Mycoplasma sp. OR1901 TaxID=2742195 RepID=UPI001583BB0C|nr:TrkA family potassium uptake protein [Mycoplasma sp. OR1901]QKT05387.1 TrkA family potassium uptake protein [Mycoplasma sp. OR1901]